MGATARRETAALQGVASSDRERPRVKPQGGARPTAVPRVDADATVLSLSGNPGLDLGSLDAPGCVLHVNTLDLLLTGIGSIDFSTDVSWPLPPGVPSGTHLYAQAAAFTTLNAFGPVTSNGLDSRIENVRGSEAGSAAPNAACAARAPVCYTRAS